MRYLGDKYVKSEFRQHAEASPEFVSQFMNTWRIYAEKLEEQTTSGGTKFGFNLGDQAQMSLSPEQRERVDGLKEQITKIAPEEASSGAPGRAAGGLDLSDKILRS